MTAVEGEDRWPDIDLPALRHAAQEVLARWEIEGPPPGSGLESMDAAVVAVAEHAGRLRNGAGESAVEAIQDPALAHRIADSLEAELIRSWKEGDGEDPAVDAEEALSALSALKEFRTSLWSDDDDAEDLSARLSRPDAFELIVGLAHDLRSPLSSILFLSETLRSEHSGSLNDLQKSQLGLIYSAAFGILAIANDVMEMAKARENPERADPAPFSIGGMLENVHEMVRPMAEEKGVDLEFRVPECRPRVGHATLLSRVLLNLTTNALKFTEEGGVTVSVEKVGRTRLLFSVEDTGRGIDEEQQEELFRPFKASSWQEGHFFSSSGLGLTIVRRLLGIMGAELELESEPGEGTRFFFELQLPHARSR